MTDASPFLQLQAIVKRFPGVLALNNVGLDVVQREDAGETLDDGVKLEKRRRVRHSGCIRSLPGGNTIASLSTAEQPPVSIVVPFASIAVSPGDDSFSFEGGEGITRIPLHRVHTVYKDGAVIWQRPQRGTA